MSLHGLPNLSHELGAKVGAEIGAAIKEQPTNESARAYLVKRGYNPDSIKSVIIFKSGIEILFVEYPKPEHFTSVHKFGELFIAIIEKRDYKNESVTGNLL